MAVFTEQFLQALAEGSCWAASTGLAFIFGIMGVKLKVGTPVVARFAEQRKGDITDFWFELA